MLEAVVHKAGMNDTEFANELNALRPNVTAYARCLCKNDEAAEDYVQDAFVRAWRYRADMHTNMSAWLRKIVHNTFVNACIKSPGHVSLETIPEESEMLLDTRSDIAKDAEDRDIIRRALDIDGAPECLGFLASGGVGTNEYADRIGVNRQTFKVRVLRMRQKLAQSCE